QDRTPADAAQPAKVVRDPPGKRMAGAPLLDRHFANLTEQTALELNTAALERVERTRERKQIHLLRGCAHEGARAALGFDQPSLREQARGLAHGRSRDAKTARQL